MQSIKELRMYYLLEEVHPQRYTLEETSDKPGASSRRLPSLSTNTLKEQGFAYYIGVELFLVIMPWK